MIFLKLKHETRMERIVDEDTDSIYIFPSTRELLYDTELIGNGFDKELVSNNVISKFI